MISAWLAQYWHWLYSGAVTLAFFIYWLSHHRKPAAHFIEIVPKQPGITSVILKGKIMISMLTGQTCNLLVQPVAADGVTPGVLDGPPTWAVDNPDVTLTPTPDGLTCAVVSTTPGTCNVTPTGSGVGKAFTGAPFAITVTARPQPATGFIESSTPPVDVTAGS